MDSFDTTHKRKMISWPVLALMDFVTVIGFDDIIYNFKNQGLATISEWIIMLALYVVPYEMMVGQLGSTFSDTTGGLTSWIRHTSGDKMGYFMAWAGWVCAMPYLVDVANSTVVSFGWLFAGNNSYEDKMNNWTFALLTAVVFIIFIFFQYRFANSLQILSVIGGGAMFIITVLYIIMTFAYLGKGGHIETQPFNWRSIFPTFDTKFFTSLGLFIFAMDGAEFVAPYVTEMKNGARDFPKAMIMLAVMTGFLTVFGSFALGVFFNAHHLPDDLKMNGSYYAFEAMGKDFGLGKFFLYLFIVTQALYMIAQLAMLVDGMSREFLSDTAKKYLPKGLTKKDKNGLPIHGYWLTALLCSFIMFSSATLPNINSIFNQLLNLNGIIDPFTTSFIFWAFIKIREDEKKYHAEYVYIKNRRMSLIMGWWCFLLTLVAAFGSIFQVDAPTGSTEYYQTIFLNVFESFVLLGLGLILPLIARWQRNHENA